MADTVTSAELCSVCGENRWCEEHGLRRPAYGPGPTPEPLPERRDWFRKSDGVAQISNDTLVSVLTCLFLGLFVFMLFVLGLSSGLQFGVPGAKPNAGTVPPTWQLDAHVDTRESFRIAMIRLEDDLGPDGAGPSTQRGNDLVFGLRDGWRTRIRYETDGYTFRLRSAGPDGEFHTDDDLLHAWTR